MQTASHTRDEHCTVDPAHGCCTTCGAEHGPACPSCGGRAYHTDNCPALAEQVAPTDTDVALVVIFDNGDYRLHAPGCGDIARTITRRNLHPTQARGYRTTSLADIAAGEFSDFIDENPDYWTPQQVLDVFRDSAHILPCAAHIVT